MKRVGRQHGMVRTYKILPTPLNTTPGSRIVNQFDSPPTAGLFTKVSTKPTNHSKFTGKCGRSRCSECHVHPACKSKDKGKGNKKTRSSDDGSDYGSMRLRVVGVRSGVKFSGLAASGILDHLDGDHDHDHENVEGVNDGMDEEDGSGLGIIGMDGGDDKDVIVVINNNDDNYNNNNNNNDDDYNDNNNDDSYNDNNNNDDEDDKMSFCEVGIGWEQVEGEEGWCLVEEK